MCIMNERMLTGNKSEIIVLLFTLQKVCTNLFRDSSFVCIIQFKIIEHIYIYMDTVSPRLTLPHLALFCYYVIEI